LLHFSIDAHGVGEGERGLGSKKFGHKNAIKQEKGDPLDFSDNPKYLLKRIWTKPQGPPPGFPTSEQHSHIFIWYYYRVFAILIFFMGFFLQLQVF
jgi:hypothetical protein